MFLRVLLLALCVQTVTQFTFAQKTKPADGGASFYKQRLDDPDAVYFTPQNFLVTADGKTDVSDALQKAINTLKATHNFGVLFIPQGTYLITKTIYIPQAIRLIGYGDKRPEFVLGKNSPGFQKADSSDKGKAKYMFWFTSRVVQPGQPVSDAGAGTFYSAMSNINLKIDDGNPYAIALRTHFAQHSFVSHIDIHIGNGKAGIFDVGNELSDVRFFDGDYGIYTTKPSPGWQFMMLDTYFEGQRKAAIDTREAGLTIVRMRVNHVPKVIDIASNYMEKLFMEDCRFSDISGPAITISLAENAGSQTSLRNIDCSNVPMLISFRETGKSVPGAGSVYKVKNFMHGLQMSSLQADAVINTITDIIPLTSLPALAKKDIPELPPINTWVNIQKLGATGDGKTDDTKAIQAAIDQYPVIYVPQGWYKVSQTIKLKPNTVLIGLNPISTQFFLENNTEAFGGFGGPKALLESANGGVNIVSGIGLSTGADNTRAVACKWMAGEGSYLNDVKFIGGHGTMPRIWNQPQADPRGGNSAYARAGNGTDPSWDTQYWSLWVTDGGGGTFENLWSANTYAAAGIYVSNTTTPGRMYAVSVEHHVRNEVRFNNVANWKVYALQLEEESRESTECQPLDIAGCKDMVFANLYMFRVIRVIKPYPYSIRNWGSSNVEFLNVHNFSQIKYTTGNPLYDVNSNTTVRPWEFNRLLITAGDDRLTSNTDKLATGFEMPEGICHDSKGNVYFCESRLKHIYKWSAATQKVTLLADYPWEPLSLACDKNDNLLVVFKYIPKPGYLVNGKPEVFTNPPDAGGTSFSGWGNSGFATWVYSIDPANPDETISLLPKVKMGSVQQVYKALYPAHRWRDFHDFNAVTVNKPAECFVAPDGATIIPVVYDLARSATLAEAWPGKPLYETDEYDKRTVKLDVSAEGYPSNLRYFAEKGEFSSAVDSKGNVYIADGEIYVYSPDARLIKTIKVPERPTTISIYNNTLYLTGYNSVYRVGL
jgi:polygalacturonase